MKGLSLVTLLCITLPLAAQGIERTSKDYLGFLPSEALDKLYSAGEISDIKGSVNDLPLWQKSPFAASIRAALEGLDITIAAEGFFLINRPAVASQDIDPKIFNSFTAFSTLKGLQALSVSKGRYETFLYDASLVDPQDRARRLPDIPVTTVPAHAQFVVYEKEEQTGDSYATFSFVHDEQDDTFEVSVTNLTPMNWLGFRLVDSGNLRTYFYVVPCKDRLILYGLTCAQTARLFGLERVKEKSFYNRMRALVSWFTDNVTK